LHSVEDEMREIVDFARNSGATEARIINSEDIVLDKRARLKCMVPRCRSYDHHLLCPPNLISVEEFDEIIHLYKKAIVVQIEMEYDSSDKSDRNLTGDLCEEIEERIGIENLELPLHRLINSIETFAFKKGFYLAAGFIGGECCLCETCVTPRSGQPCRHPFESRPSMEAMGIDVFRTCKNCDLPLSFSSRDKVRWTGLVLLY